MAGAYCRYCDRRCFVFRQVIVDGQVVWAGHMATCTAGMHWDKSQLGVHSAQAHNPAVEEDSSC